MSASIALVGASVIAASPVEPPPVELTVASPAVQLAAIPSPLQLYPQVFGTALENAGALLSEYFADPFPIIAATLRNQGSALEDAFTALEFGRFDEFAAAVADVFIEPFTSVSAALSHVDAILRQPFALEGFFLIAISPVLSGIAATGNAMADVFEAITTLDVVGLVNAVVNIPARIIDGVLNGVPGTSFGILENLPGLLTPSDPESDLPPGPISVGINLDQDAGAAIPPRTPIFPPAEPPDPDAAMLTVDLPVETESAQQDSPQGTSLEKVAADLPTPDLSEGDALTEDDGDVVAEESDETTPEDEEAADAATDETSTTDEDSGDDDAQSTPTPSTSDDSTGGDADAD